MANLIRSFGITPHAAIGYSLGESAALFAMGAWPDRDNMLKRMLATDLFSSELAGPCHAARNAWGIPMDEDDHSRPKMHSKTILENTEANRRWIGERRLELSKLYPYKFICVQDRRVVSSGTNLKATLAEVPPAPDMVCEYIVPETTVLL